MVQTNYVENNGKQVRVYRTCVSWSQGQGFCAKVWQYKSCSENCIISLKNFLLFDQARIRQTESVVMMTKKGLSKIVNLMTCRAGVLVLGHDTIGNMSFVLLSLAYTRARIKQTMHIVIMTKKGFIKIENSTTPRRKKTLNNSSSVQTYQIIKCTA